MYTSVQELSTTSKYLSCIRNDLSNDIQWPNHNNQIVTLYNNMSYLYTPSTQNRGGPGCGTYFGTILMGENPHQARVSDMKANMPNMPPWIKAQEVFFFEKAVMTWLFITGPLNFKFLKPFNDWSLLDRSQPSRSRGAGPLQVEVTNFIHSEPLQWLAQERILSAAASSLFVLQEHWKANAWQDEPNSQFAGLVPNQVKHLWWPGVFFRNGPQWRNDSKLDEIWEYGNKPSGLGHDSWIFWRKNHVQLDLKYNFYIFLLLLGIPYWQVLVANFMILNSAFLSGEKKNDSTFTPFWTGIFVAIHWKFPRNSQLWNRTRGSWLQIGFVDARHVAGCLSQDFPHGWWKAGVFLKKPWRGRGTWKWMVMDWKNGVVPWSALIKHQEALETCRSLTFVVYMSHQSVLTRFVVSNMDLFSHQTCVRCPISIHFNDYVQLGGWTTT